MARAKSAYVCAECGASALQWFGSCPSCGVAGSLTETAIEKNTPHRYAAQAVKAIALETVDAKELERIASGLPELDRGRGGGRAAGQVAGARACSSTSSTRCSISKAIRIRRSVWCAR